MTELTGTLEGVGLPAIVRFLSGLNKSGCLRVAHEDWRGDVFFDSGRVVSASFASKHGTAAIDALVQALPTGTFAFDSEAPVPDERNVELDQAELETHLDEVAATTANGQMQLPALDAIPHVVTGDDEHDEQLPLDRAMLQTLLTVDGQHSVRELVGQRGTLDVLWQIASLVKLGVVRLDGEREPVQTAPPAATARSATIPPAAPVATAAPAASVAPAAPLPLSHTPAAPAPVAHTPAAPSPLSHTPAAPPPVAHTPAAHDSATTPEPQPAHTSEPTRRCPLLGFEDDPQTSFGRPTRLHRCFAAASPLPLSLDQQRELCLSDQFPTCSRLANFAPASKRPQPPVPDPASRRPQPAVPEPAGPVAAAAADEPRIVRLPFAARAPSAARAASAAAPSSTPSPTPARMRAFNREPATTARPTPEPAAQPTPLRARAQRIAAPAADRHTEPVERVTRRGAPLAEPARPEEPGRPEESAETPTSRSGLGASLLTSAPLPVLAGAAVVLLVVLFAAGYLVLRGGLLNSLTADDSLDPAELPNASAVAAGTPVAALPVANARATAPARTPGADASSAPDATAIPTVAAPNAQGALLDESFADNARNWPSNAQGTAWLAGGAYRIATRQAGQFVAIDAPLPSVQQVQDVVVSATFHKVGGPPGGGYGILIRNQAPGSLDGSNQNGRYYVVEAGDKGEVGIWLRDNDHWVDLLPWQRSDAVRPGNAVNELTVRAIGDQLTLLVNGAQAATRTDATLKAGGAGLFVGGDGNQVSVDHFAIQTP